MWSLKSDSRRKDGERVKATEKAVIWVKEHENLLAALVMSLLPLLCCVVTCALQGQSIGKVYLPASEWNDELFYFKQVEGIIRYGFPQGYFGFNESHALKLSFAAWSPVLVWPWFLWGLLFGWNLQSPIYCNMVLMMVTMFGFVRLVKPHKKQLGVLAILFAAFTPFTRYILSGMPEVICFAMVIYVFALGISYQRRVHGAKLVILFVMTVVMVLMRPYLIVFMLLPVYFLIRKKRWLGLLISGLIGGVTGVLYIVIKHYLGAEYFAPLFDTTWVGTFLEEGIFAGIKYMLYRLWTVGGTFMGMLWEGFASGLAAGSRFAGFMLVMVILFWQAFVNFRRKEKDALIRNLYLAICFLGMWIALLLMYKMDEGSKHLHTFTAVGIFAISLMETRLFRKVILTAVVFVYLYVLMALNPYEYQIPFATQERVQQVAAWEEIFEENLEMTGEDTPNFDNAIIWVFDDAVGDGREYTPWQYLYSLPEGFGISCCLQNYVLNNFQDLQCRYLAVVQGGQVEEMCVKAGLEQLGVSGGMVVYVLR